MFSLSDVIDHTYQSDYNIKCSFATDEYSYKPSYKKTKLVAVGNSPSEAVANANLGRYVKFVDFDKGDLFCAEVEDKFGNINKYKYFIDVGLNDDDIKCREEARGRSSYRKGKGTIIAAASLYELQTELNYQSLSYTPTIISDSNACIYYAVI